MYYKCCVPNCGNTRKDAILHKFPTSECSEYRLNKWLRCLNLQRSSVANLFVCQAHFEKRFVGPNSRLLSKAYPSLFTRNEISSGTPENHAGNSLLREHNYCRANLHYDHNYCKELPSPSAHYVDGKKISETIKNTAETVSFLDDLFDSINGSSTNLKKCQGKSLCTAVTDKSRHHIFWPEAIKKLESIRFVDRQGCKKVVPTLKNFITTIKTYMKLWQLMKSLGVKVMRPRYFNTDPIENFFGQVRAYNYRNNNPTCQNFINTFKSLTVTRVLKFHSCSYSCEEDSADPLIGLQSLFEAEEQDRTPASITTSMPFDNQDISQNIMEQVRKERLHIHSRAYTAGWVLKKLFDKLTCKNCKNQLTSRANDSVHTWISQREFKECRKERKLVYPSTEVVRYFGTILAETNNYLEESAHKFGLREKIISRICNINSFDLVHCKEHKKYVESYFLTMSIRLGIFNWCKVINNILNGKDVKRLKKKQNLPAFQKLALLKYTKKLKNKGNKN